MDDKLQAYDPLEMLNLNLMSSSHGLYEILNLDDDHHLMSSSHGLYEILLLMHADGKIPNPHRKHKDTYMMG